MASAIEEETLFPFAGICLLRLPNMVECNNASPGFPTLLNLIRVVSSETMRVYFPLISGNLDEESINPPLGTDRN
jgi:hypothetical protein